MVKIQSKPIDIKGLKVYKKMSPSKFADKFGNLDLDNIPPSYMKTMQMEIGRDDDNMPIFETIEYFDSIQYRKDVLAKKPSTPLDPNLTPVRPVAVMPAPAPEPDMTPADIGGDFKDDKSDVIPESVDLEGNNMAESRA